MSLEPTNADVSISKTTAVTNDTSTDTSMIPAVIDDESLEEAALKGGDDDNNDDNDSDAAAAGDASIGIFDDDLPDYTPPLRIHSIRGTSEQPRLTGSNSQLQGLPALHHHHKTRRRSHDGGNSSRPGSRSGSESPSGGSRGSRPKYGHFDGGSSISSLEDAGIDIDILTDKMGVLELDLKTQQEIAHTLNKSLSNLPAVNERLCDETLEDVHAFSDVKGREQTGTLSRGGSITTGGEVSSNVLEPLEEIEEHDDDSAEGAVKITNLAEILEAPDEG
ncbi:hypothetical protein IV203_030157 [Nitzschia inconspicua]|uniref:Uncharacterized protein n=1 Tax=Nitzschia inconspicua TaxID=303405 RepID=A0A9K3K5E3_9STRA|nr:hypothetical protein IV203_004888 [Nitzschia inconspicua]KAG7367486.1 hypothetical protein IV203_030157 [Nitzschia inconspicua]